MENKYGKVYIAGAGCGDKDLITVKAADALKRADVVLFDNLANSALLAYCKPDVEKYFVGKEAGLHHVRQEDTIAIMIEKAKAGKTVVRLKGGDPLIFGRGGEEAVDLKKENIEYEIIPGITAASGATTYAGIPLTHRKLVTQCVFATAHETPDKPESQAQWKLIAQMKHTSTVLYMGARNLPLIAKKLIEYGLPSETPAAAIENGTTNKQKTVVASIADLPEKVAQASMKPPLITIISPAVELRAGVKWFENKPLYGKSVVVTRAVDQAGKFIDALEREGAAPILFPCIRTTATKQENPVSKLFESICFEWIFFSSENGVRYFFDALERESKDARTLGKTKIAVIGSGTANRLAQYSLKADFSPKTYTSEALVAEFAEKYDVSGSSILRVKGYFDQDPLTDNLRKLAAAVETLPVYHIEKVKPNEREIAELVNSAPDAITFASGSTVDAFFEALGDETANKILRKAVPVAIGPVTDNSLKKRGISRAAVAKKHNIDGMIELLKEIL